MEFNVEVADQLAQVMSELPEAKAGKLFGMPGYKVKGKVAVGMFENLVVAKVGPERTKALVGQPGIGTFEPMPGRTWKDWISISDLTEHQALLEEAVRYVAENS
ncbi:MAG: hypothetical protein GC204_00325 [Chloroflexi bacterium]|nr:hypothetical protein [Chloroflexota bacterium]